MKLLTNAFVLLGLAAMASAQGTTAAPPSQSVAGKPAAAMSGSQTKSPFVPPPVVQAKPAQGKAKPAAAADKKAASTADAKSPSRGRRDPFVSPIVKATTGGIGLASCSTGKRCISPDEVILRGVIKAQSGMIAVVENNAHKTYFLRENDPVFNGYVMKITGDSVVFKQNAQDTMGQPTSREVVKRVAPTA